MQKKLSIGLLGAMALFLGYPNPFMQFPLLSLIFPAVLLFLALYAQNSRQAFRHGFFTGLAGCTACLYWIAVPIHDFGYIPWVLSVLFPFALGAYVAIYTGLFSLAVYKATPILMPSWPLPDKNNNYLALLKLTIFCALAWAILEYLRGWFLTGFPWLTLSSAFVPWPWAIQGLSALGNYALSGLYAGIAIAVCLVALYMQERSEQTDLKPIFAPIAFIVISLALVGAWTVKAFSPQGSSTMAIGLVLVQGNIDQDQKWNQSYQYSTFEHYRRLTDNALEKLKKSSTSYNPQTQPDTPPYTPPIELVIWPETAIPIFYKTGGPISQKIRELAQSRRINLLFGAPDFEPMLGKTFEDFPLYNRAYLINSAGQDMAFYEKEHLVPFGEYAPSFLRLPILNFLLAEVGDMEPGIRTAPLKIEDAKLGMLICYEAIFQELAQKRVTEGATILITISNDAWFGSTSAPEQHLQLSMMRAVEQGRWLVRSTNTGISAIIDPLGHRVVTGKSFVPETITSMAYSQTDITLFHIIEPYLPYALILLLGILVLPGIIRQRLKKHQPKS